MPHSSLEFLTPQHIQVDQISNTRALQQTRTFAFCASKPRIIEKRSVQTLEQPQFVQPQTVE